MPSDILEEMGWGWLPNMNSKLEIGKGKIITEGNKVCILNFGARLPECLTVKNLKTKESKFQ